MEFALQLILTIFLGTWLGFLMRVLVGFCFALIGVCLTPLGRGRGQGLLGVYENE